MGTEIISFKMASDWINKLYGKLVQVRSKKTKLIDGVSDLIGNPLELAEHYVEPDCQQFNPADDAERDSNVIRTPAFNYLENTFLNGDKNPGTGKNQLFILSDAGMGKTSFMSIIWLSYITDFWPKHYHCKLLKLGPNTLEEIKKIDAKRQCFLLLDGLDEDPESWGKVDARIKDLLKASQNFYRVAITCRTQFFSGGSDPFNRRGHVELSSYLCPVIYLSLFTDKQVDLYLTKKFRKNKSYDASDLERLRGIIISMGKLRFRPMLLAHSEDLLQSEVELWNEYTVYGTLITAWLHRELRKDVWSKLECEPKIDTLLDVASDLAFILQKYKSPVLKEEYFENLIVKNENAELLRFLDVGGRSFFNKNSDGEFRFAHYSVQEYLLAKGVVSGYFSETKSIRATDQIVEFVVVYLNSLDKANYRFSWHVFDLSNVSFANQNLIGFNMSQLDLYGVDFYGADLRGVDFGASDLRNCNFVGSVNLDKAILDNALYDDDTDWPDKKNPPQNAIFIGTNCLLDGLNLSGKDLSSYDLRHSVITNTKFIGCNFNDTTFNKSKLHEVDFSDCSLNKTDFSDCDIFGSCFNEAKGSDSNFTSINMKNSEFVNTELVHAIFDEGDLSDVVFQGAKVEYCSFHNTNLHLIDFSGASLSNSSGLGGRERQVLEAMNIDDVYLHMGLTDTIRT